MPRSVAELLPTIPPATASLDGLAPAALITGDAGATFNSAAIDLSATRAYDDYAQSGTIELALTGGTHFPGGTATVRVTGDGSDVTVDGVTVFWADGTAGAKTWSDQRTLALYYHPGLGAALAIVPGDGGGSMTAAEILAALQSLGSPTPGLDADLLDEQHASELLDRTNHTGTQAISTVTGLQTALDSKQAVGTPRTVTAAGDTNLLTTDGTVEFVNTAGDQTLVLPDISGFTRGQRFHAVAQADDETEFAVYIEPAVADEMRSQPQTPGHDATVEQVQVGIASSVYAKAEIEVGASKWIVTGQVREPTPALAPDQFADLIQWHDAFASSFTGSPTVSSWAARAGSGAYGQATGGLQPTIVGTPGAGDYGLSFAADDMTFAQTNGWTTDSFAVLLVFNCTADYLDNREIYTSDTANGTPRIRLYKLSGNIRLALPTGLADSSDINLGALTGGRYMVLATGNAGLLHVHTTGPTTRFNDTYTTPTWVASKTRRASVSSASAGSVAIHTIAEFTAAKNADDWRALRKYAVSRGWIS